MPWLLDTNAWITFQKPGNPTIASRLAQCVDGDIVLCSIVKAELWHGANKYGNRDQRLARLTLLFDRHISYPFDDAAAWQYGRIRHELETVGAVIGPNDLTIAAICCARSLTLVTSNVGEFSRVAGLQVEDWT